VYLKEHFIGHGRRHNISPEDGRLCAKPGVCTLRRGCTLRSSEGMPEKAASRQLFDNRIYHNELPRPKCLPLPPELPGGSSDSETGLHRIAKMNKRTREVVENAHDKRETRNRSSGDGLRECL
jgi:hypothetical protein